MDEWIWELGLMWNGKIVPRVDDATSAVYINIERNIKSLKQILDSF